MERVKLNRTVRTWADKERLFADDISIGNCVVDDEALVGLSLLAQDQTVIAHIHIKQDIALYVYRLLGEAIMQAGPIDRQVRLT